MTDTRYYGNLQQLKTELSISTNSDDQILERHLRAAKKAIDAYCGRRFLAETATRYYSYRNVRDGILWLDDDLLTVDTLTNADGSVLTSGYYRLYPRNSAPYHQIRLLSTAAWAYVTDGEISIEGTWGYTATPDDLIVQCSLWLANYFYRLKDSPVFDVTATPELGQITIPKGMPQQLVVHLASLRRRAA